VDEYSVGGLLSLIFINIMKEQSAKNLCDVNFKPTDKTPCLGSFSIH